MLRSLGVTLVLIGVLVLIGLLSDGARFWTLVAAAVLLANVAYLFVAPPVVVIASDADLRLGGRLTSRPVWLPWPDITGVEQDGRRLLFTRGDQVVAFPLAYVGDQANELVRDVYDRLNTANGYVRFNPS